MNSLEKLKVAVWNVDKCILVSRGISVDTTKPLWNREEKTAEIILHLLLGNSIIKVTIIIHIPKNEKKK